jgi:ABC-type iron transport system FetAB permease component
MDIKALRSEVQQLSSVRSWVIILLVIGLLVILAYFVLGLVRASIAGLYWSEPKAVRDAAQPGSPVLGYLVFLQSTNSWLEPLKFIGLSLIIFGIAMLFAIVILGALRQRLKITREIFQELFRKGVS